jgi:hypothetical protein
MSNALSAARLSDALALAQYARVRLEERVTDRRQRRSIDGTLRVIERGLWRLYRIIGSPEMPQLSAETLGAEADSLCTAVSGAVDRACSIAKEEIRISRKKHSLSRVATLRRLGTRLSRAAKRVRSIVQPPVQPTRQMEFSL